MAAKKKKVSPVVAPPPATRDVKSIVRTWRLKPPGKTYGMYSAESEEAPLDYERILKDIAARADTMERCGIAPRISASDEEISIYYWRTVPQ